MVLGFFKKKDAFQDEIGQKIGKVAEQKEEKWVRMLREVEEMEKRLVMFEETEKSMQEELVKLRKITNYDSLTDKVQRKEHEVKMLYDEIEKLRNYTPKKEEKRQGEPVAQRPVEQKQANRHVCGGIIVNKKCVKCGSRIL